MNWPPNPGNRVELFSSRIPRRDCSFVAFSPGHPKKVWRRPGGSDRIKQLLSRPPMRPTDGLGCSDLPFGQPGFIAPSTIMSTRNPR